MDSVTQCIICQKTLGQESRDLGYLTCHEHRTCKICNTGMHPREIKLAYDTSLESGNEIELIHARCSVHSELRRMEADPTITVKQSHLDYLNMIRLMVDPDMDLSVQTNENNAMIQTAKFVHEMDWDKRYAHLAMLEACAAQVRLLIAQDPKHVKAMAAAREQPKQKKAKQEAETSSRPSSKPSDDGYEISLAEFMKNFNIKSRKVAIKLQRERDKAVESLVKLNIPATLAKHNADAMLKQNIVKGLVKLEE